MELGEGLPGLANKDIGHPVKLEFQISNTCFLVSMFHAIIWTYLYKKKIVYLLIKLNWVSLYFFWQS